MKDNNNTVVVVAAHPDDEVLGCGGTLARWANEGKEIHILLLSDGESSRIGLDKLEIKKRQDERSNAAYKCATILGCKSVKQLDFPDNRMSDTILLDVVQAIEDFIYTYNPSILLTHHSSDVNIDHRVIHDAVLAACRPQPEMSVKKLLFFEIPSSTEWNTSSSRNSFCPNWFCDISSTIDKKMEALSVYDDEMRDFPHPRSYEAIEALAKWRGASVGLKAAEAFELGRMIN